MQTLTFLNRAFFVRLLPLLMLAFAGTAAVAQTDPPSRVASLSFIDGSVVFAPAGDTEWGDAVLNRPVTRGDRLWADRGAKAELHAGASVLHVDGETFVDVTALDANAFQASVKEGAVSARVRQLGQGENFEIDTPNLAFRAAQPGDFRIDVDARQGTTRVTVRGGAGLVYGANGQGQQLRAGQQVTFSGRDLQRVTVQAPAEDAFDRWAAERDRQEDQSIAARHVPREVVGYPQLDPYGTWAEDASYGAVWYPQVTVADWAPYRYGHWEWIAPWGWTWIDDAPWGFAPFHYGRWAMIGSRWAWVPGRFGPRPVYAPALVTFVGGAGGASLSLSIGDPGIGWFPLAPGEAWRPAYRTTAFYLGNVNRYVGPFRQGGGYAYQHRERAFTAVRVDDFRRGRPVHSQWRTVGPIDLARTQVLASSAMPAPQRLAEATHASRPHNLPLPQLSAPAFTARAQPQMHAPRIERHEWAQTHRAMPHDGMRLQQERPQRQQVQREHAMRQQQTAQQQWQRHAEGHERGWQGHGAGRGRGPEHRDDNRSQREEDGGRGRGHGHGRS